MRPGAFSLLFRMHTTSLGFDDVSDLSLRNSTISEPRARLVNMSVTADGLGQFSKSCEFRNEQLGYRQIASVRP